MRHFQAAGHSYVLINGKTFNLLRGYTVKNDKWVFVQVYGTAALTKDDLPEKNWELIVTRGAQARVFTAWKPGYFDGSNELQLTVAVTREGALQRLLADRQVDVAAAIAALTASEYVPYDSGIETVQDRGDAGCPAYRVQNAYKLTAWLAPYTKEAACPPKT